MQVVPLTPSAAPASTAPAEDTGSRAEQFARMLQNAFFGSGTKSVTRAAEPAAPEMASRQPPRASDKSSGERRDPPATASRGKQPAAPSKPAEKTQAAATRPAEKTQSAKPADSADAKTATDKPAAEDDATEATAAAETPVPAETEDGALPETVPVAADMAPSELLLILNLLQEGQVAPEGQQVAPAQAEDLAALASVQPDVPAGEAPAAPVVAPAAADAAAMKAAAAAQVPVLPESAEQPAVTPDLTAAAKTTETSAAALLMQQQDMSAEDFAAIQQALAAQNQQAPATASQAVKPAARPAAEGTVTVEVQSAQQAPKTLVDQSALLSMQGDDAAEDASLALVQQQAQPQPQPAAPEAKFAAVLQAQSDAAPQPAAAQPHSPPHLTAHGAPQAAQAAASTQASQQAATQTAARHLAGYVPAGEQVAVQIKRGIGEGLDRISIRLDPGSLGKVEVKMEVGHDGKLMAVIAADKPETLAMLQRDAQSLDQSLRDAGLKTGSDSLSFQLRDQNQAGEGRDGQGGGMRQRGHAHDDYAGAGQATDPAAIAAANAQRAADARGGLDIRI